jgi:hypothetical protein
MSPRFELAAEWKKLDHPVRTAGQILKPYELSLPDYRVNCIYCSVRRGESTAGLDATHRELFPLIRRHFERPGPHNHLGRVEKGS